MQLKYHDDIKWQDLPKIERPTIAQSTVRYELSRPLSGLRGPTFNDPLSDIYKSSCRDIDPAALNRLLTKIEEGSVLLVRTFEGDTSYPAFIWKADDQHPDKGHFILGDHVLLNAEYRLTALLNTVKRPQQGGSIKAAAVTTAEYGYIPSTPTSTVAESPVVEIAGTIAKFLYQVGSKAVILSTLKPSTAGGTTTYEIANDPDLRIIESDAEPARYQRQLGGEWQTTGVPAKRVVNDGRSMGFEALSPEDAASLKSTGGIPVAPQAKPTIEGYPPDGPSDTSKTMFPDKQGEVDSSSSSFPDEGSKSMGNPGYGDTDARDVVGSSVMYNESGDANITKASELPVVKPGTQEWSNAVDDLNGLGKGKLNIRTETSTDAKALLKEARGNMDRRKNYTSQSYKKGYEIHNIQNSRELGAGNDLQHLKWKDGKSGGHIYYGKAK